jgi:hypothetical protein
MYTYLYFVKIQVCLWTVLPSLESHCSTTELTYITYVYKVKVAECNELLCTQDDTTCGSHPTGDFSLQLLAMSKQDQSLKAATHH